MEKNDFTLYEKNGDIYSIGIKFDNYLRKYNLPAMIGGGGGREKHNKTHFSSLGLPIGLTLLDNQIDLNGEYYVSLAYKYLFKNNLKVSVYPIQHFISQNHFFFGL